MIDPSEVLDSKPRPLNIDLMKLVAKIGAAVIVLVMLLGFVTRGDRACDHWRAAVDGYLATANNLTKTGVEFQRAEERRLYEQGVLWYQGELVNKPAGCAP